jgi:hypothetical protein
VLVRIDFDKALITLPGARTKGGREHVIPLAPAAIAALEAQPRRVNLDWSPQDFVFGHDGRGWRNWSFCKGQLNARINPPIPGWARERGAFASPTFWRCPNPSPRKRENPLAAVGPAAKGFRFLRVPQRARIPRKDDRRVGPSVVWGKMKKTHLTADPRQP